ncbi:MAG: DUF2169 domain-containing protein [Minicystis sp.]
MKIVCYGPWRAASLLWQPHPGAWALTVACHAVFELLPNESPVAAKPLPLDPVKDDDERAFVEPWGPPAPFKRHPEVIVVGHAYAPPGRKVTSLVARLGVGDLEKLLHVHGEACFTQEGALTAPIPFERMPLRWDRAAGAPYDGNPVGIAMGKDAVPDTQGRVLLPNLRPMGTSIRSRDEVVAPVGFGPIRPMWPSRIERLHRYAAYWDPERWAEHPLSADFDMSYFNVAPPDQELGAIAGNERILLEHLHPRFPRLVTYLAAATPCVVASLGGAEQNVPVVCDTLVVDSDRGLAFLVWRGQVPLPHPQQEGMVFVSAARIGASSTGTLEGASPANTALPFQRSAVGVHTLEGASTPAKTVLPFQKAAPGVHPLESVSTPAKTVRPSQRAAVGVYTLTGTGIPIKPALPFRPAAEDARSAEVSSDAGSVEEVDDEATDPPTVRGGALAKLAAKGETQPPAEGPLPPIVAPAPPVVAPAPPVVAPAPPIVAPPPPVVAPAPPIVAPAPPVVAPALPVVAPAPPVVASPYRAAPVVEPAPPARPPLPSQPRSPKPALASSIERCAAIAARIAAPGADRAAVLAAEELTPEVWEQEHTRWLGDIQDQLDRGNHKLLDLVQEQQRILQKHHVDLDTHQVVDLVFEEHRRLLVAYDAAYVAAIEELRGPLTAGEFARLSRAADRGEAAPVLAELHLPEGSINRIRRVWRAKMDKDPRAAAEVRAALRASMP